MLHSKNTKTTNDSHNMNKYILKAIFCSVLAAPVLTSCELDQFPTDSLTEEAAWESYTDATNQYRGLLSVLRSDVGGSNAYVSDVQMDLFNQRLTSPVLGKMNDWTFTGSPFDGDGVWANNYSVLLQANDVLAHIGKFEADATLTANQQANIANIKATAFFARAYAYSSMLPFYCNDYEPETAANELGLPIVEEVSSEARPARATLQETCDSIVKYMDYADAEFKKVDAYNATAKAADKIQATTTAPNADALTALRARVYLYMHKFDEAIAAAQTIVENYPLGNGLEGMLGLWIMDQGNEIVYQPVQTADEIANTYDIYLKFNIVTENLEQDLKGMNPDFLPTQNLLDLYSSKDLRRSVYFSHKTNGENSMYLGMGDASNYGVVDLYEAGGLTTDVANTNGTTEDGVIFTKFPGNPLLRKQGLWYSEIYNQTKAFRAAEAYLIIAEANLRKAARNEDEARAYLNELRSTRFDGYDESSADYIQDTVTGEALDKVMQDEWTREFVGEGFRMPCLKRWHQGFKRTPQKFNTPVLVDKGNVQTLSVEPSNIRFTWPIPQQDMQANKNLKQNAGY